jgi:hypothetical protein
MNAKDLIGQTVVRTKPVELRSGCKDYSYCSGRGVKILAATETNVIIDSGDGRPWALDERFTKDWAPLFGIAKGDVQ